MNNVDLEKLLDEAISFIYKITSNSKIKYINVDYSYLKSVPSDYIFDCPIRSNKRRDKNNKSNFIKFIRSK